MFDLNNIPFKQSPNYSPQPNSMKKIVIHTTMGSYGSSVGWLLSTNSQASCHYIISEDGSQCTQLVRDNQVAWHTGNWDYNLSCIGIEHSWFYEHHEGPPPDALLKAGAALTAKLCHDHNIVPNRGNIIRHGEIPPPNDHTDPPTLFDMNKFMSYVTQFFQGGGMFDPNPYKFSIGQGVVDCLTKNKEQANSDEVYYTANPRTTPAKGFLATQRSFTMTKTGNYVIAVDLEQPDGKWDTSLYKRVG